MGMRKMTFTGTTPLVMSNEYFREYKRLSGVPSKERTEEHMIQVLRAQWEGSLYYDKTAGPVVPGQNIQACLKEGAAKLKLKKKLAERLEVDEEFVKLDYSGPRDLDAMWEKHRDVRMAGKTGGTKRPVCRPIFRPPWSVTFTVLLDDLEEEQVLACAQQAGRFVGLCTRRCFKWGRFEVKWSEGNGKNGKK